MLAQIPLSLLPAAITYQVKRWFTGTELITSLFNWQNLAILVAMILSMTVIRQISALMQGVGMAEIRRNLELRYIDYLAGRDFSSVEDIALTAHAGNRSMMAFSRESEMLTGLIPMFYRSFLQAPLTIFSFMVLMLWMSWQMTFVVFLLVASVALSCVMLRKKIKTARNALYNRMADLFQIYSDWVKGARVLRFYDSERFICGKLENVVNDSYTLNKRLVKITCQQNIATELLTYIGVVAFIIVVGRAQSSTDWSLLLIYPASILFIRNEAIKVVNGYAQLAATESSVKHIVKTIDFEHIKPDENLKDVHRHIDSIELSQVNFAYNEGKEVLKNFSARFNRGKLNILTGKSGSGKSSCLDLITKSLQPDSGAIRINGTDLKEVNGHSLTEITALVEQSPYLIEGTLFENLTLGKKADINEILALCRDLQMERVIKKESDLLKPVYDSGLNLSAGEKQRIVFMRAILKHPSILLLDEATSAVDTHSSAIMMDYVRKMCHSTLIICVTHDPSIIQRADYLVKIVEGKAKII